MSPRAADWRKALLTSSLDAVILMDAAGRLIDFNDEASTLFLLTPGTVGRSLGDLIVPPDLREGHRAGLERFLATGVSRIIGKRIEIDAIRTDGVRFPVELTIAVIPDESPVFIAHIRDIHDRKMAERRLLATAAVGRVLSSARSATDAIQATLRALGESLQWSVVQYWTVSHDGMTLELCESWQEEDAASGENLAASTSVLRAGEGLPGKTWRTAEPQWIENIPEQEWMPRVAALRARGLNTGLAFPVVMGGQVIAVVEAFARERWPAQPELLAVLQAMGGQLGHFIEELRARKESERARHEAEEANRLKDEFLSVASHELRTPLNAVLGWAHLLRKGRLTGAAAERAVEAIERNVLIQARLVGDLLDMSRIIAGKFQLELTSLSPMEPVLAAMEVLRPAADAKHIDVRIASKAQRRVRGDAGRLQQVFWNLLANAVKFTPNGGSIEIRAVEEPDGVAISVTDTGIGMSPEFASRAFERFVQADQAAGRGLGGLGLGLSIARQFVELHGGTIRLESGGPGKGTTATVRLPFERRARAKPAAPPHTALAGVRVLFVSDAGTGADQELLSALDRAGATVERAASPEEALGCLSRAVFDVVISSLRDATESWWLTRELAAQPPVSSSRARAVAIVAAHAEPEAATGAASVPTLRHPLSPMELVKAVRSLVDASRT